MGRLFAVEIVYRGIFQKKLATNISRAIVLAAHEEGMAKYEPKEVDITIAVDDTLCKGVESWACTGYSPSTG